MKNLSKTIPAGRNYNDYQVYWTQGSTHPAVDVTVSSSGAVTYSYGTVTIQGSTTSYTQTATTKGKFGQGPNGAVEVDVPLKAMKLKAGTVLANPVGQAGTGASSPIVSFANILDSDTGKSYTVGKPTCIDKS